MVPKGCSLTIVCEIHTLINENGKYNCSTEEEIRFQSWWNEIYCFKIGSSSLFGVSIAQLYAQVMRGMVTHCVC